jgi:hypothetical protein
MLNQKCKHKEWLLVKIRGLRDFKIWQCKQCKLMLKEKTKGLHEVFILNSPIQRPNMLSSKVFPSKMQESRLFSPEASKTAPITLADSNIQLSKRDQ